MDWGMFMGGVLMLACAVVFQLSSKWAYSEPTDFNKMKKTVSLITSIVWIIGGLFVIFCSFAPVD